jgi:type I restriction enzyme M protein
MRINLDDRAIGQLFSVQAGDFHATKELDPGSVPLVSCGDTNNGVMGYFDIPPERTYRHAVTVAFNGSWPLLSKFHAYEFGAKDDVAVLIPRVPLRQETLIYVAAMLNRMTWRYSYGRKCFRQ